MNAHAVAMRHGWYEIPGIQTGDRTLKEQMLGVTPALAEAAGKTVLDLGAAEGLVGREFARAGALRVHGVDSLADHIAVAKKQCRGLPMTFRVLDLNRHAFLGQYDIVLSLGVAHKLIRPDEGIRAAAQASRDLVLIRLSAKEEATRGIIRSKHDPYNACNVHEIMGREGFVLERALPGPRKELVQYWRRAKC